MSDVTVSFGAKDEGLASSLKKFNDGLGNTGKAAQQASAAVGASFGSMIKAGAGLAVGIGAVKAVFAGITSTIGSFTDALDMGGRLSDTASRTGMLAGEVLLLERAFENTGLSADNVAGTINKMQKALAGVNEEGEPTNKTFAQLGLNMSVLKTLSPDEQFKAIATAISDIPDPAERAAAAMSIFGKSGGALLPLFRDFSGTMSDAKGQLGGMVDVMNNNASTFDAVSDKIKVIQGKFTEFAAGILSVVVPALDFITEALSRIDAATIGKQLATAFMGATTAMEGFTAAMNLIKAGDLAGAFSLAFSSIALQVKQTANEMYKNFNAAFSAAGTFLASIFDTDGALAQTAFALFEMFSQRIVSTISRGLANAFAGSILTEGLSTQLNLAANEANTAANNIEDSLNGAGGRIIEQFSAAGAAIPASFNAAYEETKPIFSNLEAEAAAVQQKMDQIPVPAAELNSIWTEILGNVEGASMSLSGNFQAGLDAAVGASKEISSNFEQLSSSFDSGLGPSSSELSDQVAALKTSSELPATGPSESAIGAASPMSGPTSSSAPQAGSASSTYQYKDSNGTNRIRIDASTSQSAFDRGPHGEKIDVYGGKTAEEFAGSVGKESPAMKMARERSERESTQATQIKKEAGKTAGGGGASTKPIDPLTAAVEQIKSLMEKLEAKLPQVALGV